MDPILKTFTAIEVKAAKVDGLHDLVRSCLTALNDLNKGYPWRELHINLPQLLQQAKDLGVDTSEIEE